MEDMGNHGYTLFRTILKVFADRGYIKQELFESLFSQGILGSFMG